MKQWCTYKQLQMIGFLIMIIIFVTVNMNLNTFRSEIFISKEELVDNTLLNGRTAGTTGAIAIITHGSEVNDNVEGHEDKKEEQLPVTEEGVKIQNYIID
eukprot:153923_1